MIGPILEARQKYKNIFVWFLVQMKILNLAFEINRSLASPLPSNFFILISDGLGGVMKLGSYLTWTGLTTYSG